MNAQNRPWDRLAGRQDDRNKSSDRRGGTDERARPPSELLDNLRLRLSHLAGNHPSGPGYRPGHTGGDNRFRGPDQPDGAAPAEADGQLTGPFTGHDADAAGGDDGGAADGDGGPIGVLGDQKRGSDAGRDSPAASADGGRPGDAVRAAAAAIASGLGVFATMELPAGGRRAGDPYRPWFMAGEPGSPWWSGQLY